MKRFVAIILLFAAFTALCACGAPEEPKPDSAQIKNDLASVVLQLDAAVSDIDSQSSFLLEHWGNVDFFAKELFIKSEWEKNQNYNSFVRSFGDTIYVWRDNVNTYMTTALEVIKTIEPTEETKEYYEAVKKYYTAVDSYRSLVENFPAGYSKITYSQAVATHKDSISTAQSELKFY